MNPTSDDDIALFLAVGAGALAAATLLLSWASRRVASDDIPPSLRPRMRWWTRHGRMILWGGLAVLVVSVMWLTLR